MIIDPVVTLPCVVAGSICFGLYVWVAIQTVRAKPGATAAHMSTRTATLVGAPGVNVGDLAKLFEAISKLTDSLAKAGPALTSLIGAILFFCIAAVSSGAIHGSPTSDEKNPKSPPAASAAAPGASVASQASGQ